MSSVYCIAQSVVTPLGCTVPEVLEAVRQGRSAICMHTDYKEPYCASLFPEEKRSGNFFVSLAIEAAKKAIEGIEITPRTGFILSTIKGNIAGKKGILLPESAREIADAIGIKTTPIVTSNACISGLAALIQGMRMIRSGEYDQVVVVGAEVQSEFIVSGFQCLKALSLNPSRPFDAEREGLNLGEAAAAVVLSAEKGPWELVDGVIRNDANHISGPSRTGEGSYKALMYVMENASKEDLAFINVHGTATLYNDEMESIALDRAGLADVPINALKGVFGHTMGAAGILESVVSMAAADKGIVLPTKGFETLGVSGKVNVSASERSTGGNSFIKLLSGFGGVNGALLFRKGGTL